MGIRGNQGPPGQKVFSIYNNIKYQYLWLIGSSKYRVILVFLDHKVFLAVEVLGYVIFTVSLLYRF